MLTCFASCQQIEEKHYEIHAEVVDESGRPLEEVKVTTGRLEIIAHAPVPSAKPVVMEPFLTNRQGIAILKFTSAPNPSGNINFYRNGYYWTSERFTWVMPDGYKGKNRTAQVKAILKPIRNPIPMIARKNLRIRTPEFGVPYGFDLELGESLPPLGNGKVADIEFILSGTRSDVGGENKEHIDFHVEIRCPNPDDGFVEFEIADSLEFSKGSTLPSGHECPAEGYVRSLARIYRNDKDGGMAEASRIKREIQNKCAYFRVRTKRDEDGKIVSAHYGKMYGPIEIRPSLKQYGHKRTGQGGFFIQYLYFNPTPNDRNVEFDPKRNLNPEGDVQHP